MKYWVNIPMQVIGYEGDLGDNIDLVVQELAKLDACSANLLDYSADSDATNDTAEFAVTVEASGLSEALATGLSHVPGGRRPVRQSARRRARRRGPVVFDDRRPAADCG